MHTVIYYSDRASKNEGLCWVLMQDYQGKLARDLTESPEVIELLEDREKAFEF
jgi:hypothetical protein